MDTGMRDVGGRGPNTGTCETGSKCVKLKKSERCRRGQMQVPEI